MWFNAHIGVAYSSSSSSFTRTRVPNANSFSIICPCAVFIPPEHNTLVGPRVVIKTISPRLCISRLLRVWVSPGCACHSHHQRQTHLGHPSSLWRLSLFSRFCSSRFGIEDSPGNEVVYDLWCSFAESAIRILQCSKLDDWSCFLRRG